MIELLEIWVELSWMLLKILGKGCLSWSKKIHIVAWFMCFLMNIKIASVLSGAICYSCFDAEYYFTWFNIDWLVLWTLVHAFRRSTFSYLLAQKFQQVKTCFPTPSTKNFSVSPPYLPISFMLFWVCLSCYFLLSIPLN